MLDHHQRGQNAEPTIVAAGVADSIVMRAQNERARRRIVDAIAPDHIADGVDLDAHAGVVHPFRKLGGDGAVRRREVGAGQAVGRIRPFRQPRGQVENALPECAFSRDHVR